ncbi:MAG: zinc ribbon domain-containing protein [Phycisphaerae bacterium]|nr:zinc ribbon domain-containing protein [Phycisphaerae bacterium]
MPIYEYTCGSCGKDFELLVTSRRAKAACPHCGSRKLTRRLSTFATHKGAPSLPCSSGKCPSPDSARTSCSPGQCPFSS